MTRTIRIILAIAATAVFGLVVYLWALRPLGFASYLSSTMATDAEIIRQYWPQRLVQPEWVTETPSLLINWSLVEAVARLALVGSLWLLLVSIMGRGVTFALPWRHERKANPPL